MDVFVTKEEKAVLWGGHLRFYKALMISFRVSAVRDAAAEWIDGGGQVVVSLIGTGEAASARIADDMDDDGGVDDASFAGLRSTLIGVLDKACAADAMECHEDALRKLRSDVETFDLPPSPLDALIDQLGKVSGDGAVVELTGRSTAWEHGGDGKWRMVKRDSGDNSKLCRRFQRGEASIAIISAAASTGISLHDSTDHQPSKRRLQIMIELPWSADTALQQMGRTHRSAQYTAPRYLLVTSDLAAEGRFAATVAKRAAALGAITSADRRSTQANSIGTDLLVGPVAPSGIRLLFDVLSGDEWPGWYDPQQPFAETKASILSAFESVRFQNDPTKKELSKRLLGRALGTPKDVSNSAIELFSAACQEAEFVARRNHSLSDNPVQDMCLGSDGATLESTSDLLKILKLKHDTGFSFDAALAKRASANAVGAGAGFAYRVERRHNGRPDRCFNVLAVQSSVGGRIRAYQPSGRCSNYLCSDFVELYKPYTDDDDTDAVRIAWDAEFELCATSCIHGCPPENKCTQGIRFAESRLLPFPGVCTTMAGLYKPQTCLVRLTHEDGTRSVTARIDPYVADRLEADAVKAKTPATAATAAVVGTPVEPQSGASDTASTASGDVATTTITVTTSVPTTVSTTITTVNTGKRKALVPPPPPVAAKKAKKLATTNAKAPMPAPRPPPAAAAAASSSAASSSRIARPVAKQKQLSMRKFLTKSHNDSDTD